MKILIFGGTTEGRILSSALSGAGYNVVMSVATEHGKNISDNDAIEILADRLAEVHMIDLLKKGLFDYVVDATHPYAVSVTQNIQSACRVAGLRYLRLKRPGSEAISRVMYVPDMAAAARILDKSDEKVFLTIGSKELEAFTSLKNFADRLFIRILPVRESLDKALSLGFLSSNIICMQGPFSKEMNIATLKLAGSKYLVTKDSGDVGGLDEKVSAALELGCEVIVTMRPTEKDGITLEEMLDFFQSKCKVIPRRGAR